MKKLLFLFSVIALGLFIAKADVASWIASEAGYDNGKAVETVSLGDKVTMAFDKGTNNNATKYYTSGSALRVYGGNVVTVTAADGYVLTQVEFTSDANNLLKPANVSAGEFDTDGAIVTWTGEAGTFSFSQTGTSGNGRIISVEVTYKEGTATPQPQKPATPTFSVPAGAVVAGTQVAIACATPDAKIYYTIDGAAPTASSTLYAAPVTIDEACTLKAVAELDGELSDVAEAAYTIKEPVEAGDSDTFVVADYFSTNTTLTTWTMGAYTFTASKGEGNNDPAFNAKGGDIRLYKSNVLTVTGPKEMKSIVFTLSAQGLQRYAKLTASEGEFANMGENPLTWKGDTKTVTFTVGDNAYGSQSGTGQFDFESITINTVDTEAPQPQKPAAPEFSIPAGEVSAGTQVALSCATAGASIHYTLDGTEPTAESTLYTEPIAITEACTIKAVAYAAGQLSEVAEAAYTIKQAVAPGDVDTFVLSDYFSATATLTTWEMGAYTFAAAKGSGTNAPSYNGNGKDVRLYKGNTLTITGPKEMLSIEFTISAQGLKRYAELTASEGEFANMGKNPLTWNGDTKTVTFTVGDNAYGTESGAGQFDFESVTITTSLVQGAVAKPEFSIASGSAVIEGTTVAITCSTEGAKIYYTTDGTEPTAESTLYAEPIAITFDTCEIKAIAIDAQGQTSAVATATYTIMPTLMSLTNLSDFEDGQQFIMGVDLTVAYANWRYTYVYDGYSYSLIYKQAADLGANAGDVIAAGWQGKFSDHNGLPEIIPVDDIVISGTAPVPAPTEVDGGDVAYLVTPANAAAYLKLMGVTFAEATPEATNVVFNGTMTDNDGETVTVPFYNQFHIDGVDAGVYDITGFVSVFNHNVQFYPTAYEEHKEPVEFDLTPLLDDYTVTSFTGYENYWVTEDGEWHSFSAANYVAKIAKAEGLNRISLSGFLQGDEVIYGVVDMDARTITFDAQTFELGGDEYTFCNESGISFDETKESDYSIAVTASFDAKYNIDFNGWTVIYDYQDGTTLPWVFFSSVKMSLEKGTPAVAPAIYSLSDLDDIEDGEEFYVYCPLTVVYAHGTDIYVYDGKICGLLIANLDAKEGDVIDTGWKATLDFLAFKPVADAKLAIKSETGSVPDPTLITIDDEDLYLHEYVKLENVVFDEATPATEEKFYGQVDGIDVCFYNKFLLPSAAADKYHITGFVGLLIDGGDSEIAFLPVKYDETTGIEAIEAAQADAAYYTLQGVRIDRPAAGTIVIRIANGQAAKVLIK